MIQEREENGKTVAVVFHSVSRRYLTNPGHRHVTQILSSRLKRVADLHFSPPAVPSLDAFNTYAESSCFAASPSNGKSFT